MTIAHIMGVPVEESALALAPAGAALLSGAAVMARSKLTGLATRLRRVDSRGSARSAATRSGGTRRCRRTT
jgi:hypothetical protein